jgi:predicted DNA-binding ribbon-helix-helix protein
VRIFDLAQIGARPQEVYFHLESNERMIRVIRPILQREMEMKSAIAKRSIVLNQHKTSISLEDDFWNCLRAIADEKKIKLTTLLLQIDSERNNANLSSAIRVFVFNEMRAQAAAAGARIWPVEQAAQPHAAQG